MSWQPIETAPKDGTWMLVACGWHREDEDADLDDWCRIVRWAGEERYKGYPWATMDPEGIEIGGTIRENIPTHWMPLPPPPTPTDVTASAARGETP